MTQTARPVQRDSLFTLAAQNGAPMVEFLFEQGYNVEPGSNEVSMGFDSALSRADVPLVYFLLDRELLGDLVKSPYENLLGSIMSTRNDIEAAATIMDTLLAHGFEIRNDLHYHQKTGYYVSRSESAYANSDRNAIYQMLLDRGANPVAGPGPETELSIAAKYGDKGVVQMILKSLDRCCLAREDLQQKLAFAEEQAKLGFAEDPVKDTGHLHIERALHRVIVHIGEVCTQFPMNAREYARVNFCSNQFYIQFRLSSNHGSSQGNQSLLVYLCLHKTVGYYPQSMLQLLSKYK